MTTARRIACFATTLRLDEVPAPVVEAAKLHLLDALGVGLAASTVPLSQRWVEAARRIGGNTGRSTGLGGSNGLTATAAALLNGSLIHSLEFDDTHTRSVVHGSAVAASAALAAAEEAGSDGGSLLAGYLAAWEVMIRLGLSAPGAFQANGFQISAVGGAIGGAVAASVVGQLGEAAAVSAIGIAGSQASGLMEFLSDGSTVKALHPGWAAHTGIAAAALAQSGMTGPASILEGRFGFLAAFARDPEAAGRLDRALDDLGTVWHLPDAAFKLYPCCHYIHPFLEALQDLIDGGLTVETLESLICEVPQPEAPLICEPWERRQHPASGYDGKWGLAYCLAALLVDGRIDVDTFAGPPAPEIASVARRMAWRPMEGHRFPHRFEAALEARLTDGAVRRVRVDDVRGAPGRPVAPDAVLAKFANNAGRTLTTDAAAAVQAAVLGLDRAPDLGPLTQALRATGQ
ncbi:MmgE/PrpD family protein [Thalassobaculum sp.]|uniref:MmgE/PrpD family protein n=1 Tax=Thalassobaculum sp. TaxID=2022740 RepID=UPI0032EDC8C1